MELKNIEFIEQYIDEEPENENSWRGINVLVNGVRFIDITLIEDNFIGDHLVIELTNIPYTIFKFRKVEKIETVDDELEDEWGFGNIKFRLKDKDKAKEKSVKILENYFRIFVK